MKIIIKNGEIVNADQRIKADVLIEGGKVTKLQDEIHASPEDKTIDANDCYVIPGGIDPHVHMHLPSLAGYSSDNFFSGSKAALFGGTTTLIDFVTPKRGQLLVEAIHQRKKEAGNCFTNISFHVSPVEWRDTMAAEINGCINEQGFKSFKVYMAYKDSIGLDDDVLSKVMKTIGDVGGIVTVHAELGDEIKDLRNKFADQGKKNSELHPLSRPNEMEAHAVKRVIEFAEKAKCPLYIVHVSTKESLKYIREAQKKGQAVFGETCPQYLLLDDSKYKGEFCAVAPFVMSPPLRKRKDNVALWEALKDGTIQTLGTDHCPFTLKQKEFGITDFRKIPNGAGGVEHRLALLYTYGVLKGKISLEMFVELTSTNAAKIFGLFPAKGIIAEGSDADIIVWDPKEESVISVKTHHQNCDNNIYEGMKTFGAPKYVILNGKIVLENGRLNKNIPLGKMLKTYPL